VKNDTPYKASSKYAIYIIRASSPCFQILSDPGPALGDSPHPGQRMGSACERGIIEKLGSKSASTPLLGLAFLGILDETDQRQCFALLLLFGLLG
jgi:hypothetical protein